MNKINYTEKDCETMISFSDLGHRGNFIVMNPLTGETKTFKEEKQVNK